MLNLCGRMFQLQATHFARFISTDGIVIRADPKPRRRRRSRRRRRRMKRSRRRRRMKRRRKMRRRKRT